MATSGSTNYSQTATNVIRDALLKCEALDEGEPITGEHLNSGLRQLNRILKRWNAKQLRWARREAILFLNADQQVYNLPTDKCAINSFGYTRLNGAHIATDTTLDVDATAPAFPMTAMASSAIIGIELTDGTRHWTTVSSVGSSTTVTIASGLASAASDDATVYWFTTQIERPVRIFNARRGTYSGAEVPIDMVARDVYMSQPNKTSASIPTLAHYQPDIATGKLYVWPVSSTAQNVLRFTYQRTIEDIDAVTDTLDMPEEAIDALIYELAVKLAPEYQLDIEKRQMLAAEALDLMEDMEAFDEDDTSVQLVPYV